MLEQLAGYSFVELLGQKGATELWSAQGPKGSVILHITPIPKADAERSLAQLKPALELAKTLRHKNILRVLDGGVEEGHRYVVSEHVEGVFLDRVLDACRSVDVWPSMELSVYVIGEIAKALAYVHQLSAPGGARLIHRELCPAGIMIDRGGGVKIVELGTQTTAQSVIETAGQKRSGLIAYSSPELATDQHVDHRSDVFALGAIAWELLAKRPLFHRATDLETLEAVRSAEIPPLPQTYPAELTELVLSCLARSPAERPESADELLEQLEPLLADREASVVAMRGLLEQVTSGSGRPKRGGTFVFSQEEQTPSSENQVPDRKREATVRSDPPSEILKMSKEPQGPALPSDTQDPFFDAVRDGGGFENDRFEILGRLGSGGMGEVYKVKDHELGEIVALKVIQGTATTEMQSLERLRREVRLARKIASDYVCRIYDIVDLGGGKRGLMMALVEGTPLAEMMKYGIELDYTRFARWGMQIAEGLAAAHALQIVHRDLKPENIMIRSDDSAILLDFGIARSQDSDDAKLTQAGIIMGTPLYMSPEQLSNRTLDGRSDLYALGLILAELITGEVPYGGGHYSEILERRVVKARLYKLNEIDPSAPWALAKVVDALLMPAADDRPAKAEAVVALLQESLQSPTEPAALSRAPSAPLSAPVVHAPATLPRPAESVPEPEVPQAQAPQVGTSPQNQQTWMIAIGLLALVVVALAIFVVRRAQQAQRGHVESLDVGARMVESPPPSLPPPPEVKQPEPDMGVQAKKKSKTETKRIPPAEEM